MKKIINLLYLKKSNSIDKKNGSEKVDEEHVNLLFNVDNYEIKSNDFLMK